MSKSDSQFEETLVDRQVLIIPSAATWRELVHNPVFLGVPVYSGHTKEMISDLIAFVLQHEEQLRLGMFRIKWLKSWSVLPLLLLEGRLQRVHIEHVLCGQCDHRVTIANPTEPSLYLGVPDHWDLLDNAFKLPRTGCPNCGAPLPRVAVWAELSGSYR